MGKKKTSDVPMLPKGCGYMGRDFGASYLDSECFGGRLYDLDDGDGDMLYEPREYLPCPNCRMEEWLERHAKYVSEGVSGREKSSLPEWQAVCRFALKTNKAEALRLLNGRFKTVAYLEHNAGGDDLIEREWTFDLAALTEPANDAE